jgi:cleavage stimulation factor subunit 2
VAPVATYPPAPTAPAGLDALAAIPDEQKAMIMRVLAMTPEQIARLPPTERASIVQLRATLGMPS